MATDARRNLRARPPSLRLLGAACIAVILASYVAVEAQHLSEALLVDYDPSTQYLLDSLNVFQGQPYTYVDHPGTLLIEMAIVGFLIATAPTAGYVLLFFNFLSKIVQHQGTYGGGAEGFTSPEILSGNLATLIAHAAVLFGLLAVASAGVVYRVTANWEDKQKWPALYAAGPAFLLQTAVLVIVIGKHPVQTYLLAVAAMLPLLAAVWLEAESFAGLWSRRALVAAAVVLGVAMLINVVASVRSREAAYATNSEANAAAERAIAQFAVQRGVPRANLTVDWTYGTANRCYALFFGVPRLGTLAASISAICGTNGEIDIFWMEASPARWDLAIIPAELLALHPAVAEHAADEDLGVPSLRYGNLQLLIAGY